MTEPTKPTIKRLFALSGNLCAFPGCSLPMVEKSGTVTGEICHIHAQNKGGPRFNEALNEKEIHEFDNLILMCGRHHKVIDDEEDIYKADTLRELKTIHENAAGRPERAEDSFFAQLLLNSYKKISIERNYGNVAINSPGAIQGNNVIVNSSKKSVKVQAPYGSIGSNLELSKYISHLIERYNQYAANDPYRKTKFSYGAISKNVSDKFGAKWQLLEESYSSDVIAYLQQRIERTRQCKINKSKGFPCYSSLVDYEKKY